MDTNFRKQTTELVTLHPFKGTGKINDRLRFDVSGLSGSETYTLAYVPSTSTFSWQNVDSVGVDTLYTADGTLTGDRSVELGLNSLSLSRTEDGANSIFRIYLANDGETDYSYLSVTQSHEILLETFHEDGDINNSIEVKVRSIADVPASVFSVAQQFTDNGTTAVFNRNFAITDANDPGLVYISSLSGAGVSELTEQVYFSISNAEDNTGSALTLYTSATGDGARFELQMDSALDANASAYVRGEINSLTLRFENDNGHSELELADAYSVFSVSDSAFGETARIGLGENEDFFYVQTTDPATSNTAFVTVHPASETITLNSSSNGEVQFTINSQFGTVAYAVDDAVSTEILYYGTAVGVDLFQLLSQSTLDGFSIPADKVVACKIAVSARCVLQGNGIGLTTGEGLVAFYNVGIKNIGGTTALVGTVQADTTLQADAGMADAVITISANDTTDILQIDFTPPSTAGTTSQFEATAHVQISY